MQAFKSAYATNARASFTIPASTGSIDPIHFKSSPMNVSSADIAEDMITIWNHLPILALMEEGLFVDGKVSFRRGGYSKFHYHIEGTSHSPSVYLEN